MLREHDLGNLTQQSKQTVSEFIQNHLDTVVKHKVQKSTLDNYKATFARYIKPGIGGRRLDQLSERDIQMMYSIMMERGIGAPTIRYTHAVLKPALANAVRWRLIPRNPADPA